MSNEPTTDTDASTETNSYEDQDWGRIAFCVVLAIIVAIGIHYIVFSMVLPGMNLSPTIHAFIGMVFFFIAGFITFSIFY